METGNDVLLAEQSIPEVDLAASEETILAVLREACQEYGFFYIRGHGLDSRVERMFRDSKTFFQQSTEEKMKLAVNAAGHGYVWYGEETLDPERQREPDTKENFQFGEEPWHSGDGRVASALPMTSPLPTSGRSQSLYGPNIWPDPNILPGWKDNMLDYYQATCDLALRICQYLALSLGLERNFFEEKFSNPLSLMAMNHYLPQRSNLQVGRFACGEHSDYVIITLLQTDTTPGLEVRLKDDSFLAVEPSPQRGGAFICNVGDAIQHLTNDYYRSAPHRVVNTSGSERLSTGLFYRPNQDFVLECLPKYCSHDNPPRYQPITFGQHLLKKYEASHSKFKK